MLILNRPFYMKKNIFLKGSFVLLAFLSLLLTQCTEPTELAGDLVKDQESNFHSVDSLPLAVKTVVSDDSLRVFYYTTVPFALNRYYLGVLDDPIFGQDTSEIISLFGPSPGNYGSKFDGATVDSVILTIVLDSAWFYGDPTAMQSIEVFRLQEVMALDSSYYQFQDFPTEPTPIGQLLDFVPNLTSRSIVIDYDTVEEKLAYIRIPLDNSIGEEILGLDSIDFTTAEKFSERFKGLKIKAQSSTGLMALKLTANYTGIDVFYQTPSEDSLILPIFPFRGYATSEHLAQNHSGAVVESYLDVPNASNFFVQAHGGLNMEIELPDMTSLGDIIVNKAILEFTLADLMEDDTATYSILPQLILTDTLGHEIPDWNPLDGRFDGKPKMVVKNGEARMVVQMNISSLLQLVQQGSVSNKVVLKASPQMYEYGRSVFQGFEGDKMWQPKLIVNFTELN